MKEAERQTGISSGNICHICKGEYRTAGEYKWRYLEDVLSK